MNTLFPRVLRLSYRKEPISSFILTVGLVDAVIGGVGGQSSLLVLGILMVVMAIVVRWKLNQPYPLQTPQTPPKGYLPPSPTLEPLPVLTHDQRQKRRKR
ncbi:hypothetical protein K4A83_19175 [Spirulina subsalsa FACHB-351]|uniref:Uncharacterized protein n=1 Tax=Spirulina subsalsa FACHB-351 TaxID=234711 RepID=A0ABT3LBB1_9CYAN|nr:hypothetical protein [Spirulina subsalsa]MCW6038379.1 hypothetical protein [Spirulina subsalsa FACHB-351]